jgi:hypothetical protein
MGSEPAQTTGVARSDAAVAGAVESDGGRSAHARAPARDLRERPGGGHPARAARGRSERRGAAAERRMARGRQGPPPGGGSARSRQPRGPAHRGRAPRRQPRRARRLRGGHARQRDLPGLGRRDAQGPGRGGAHLRALHARPARGRALRRGGGNRRPGLRRGRRRDAHGARRGPGHPGRAAGLRGRPDPRRLPLGVRWADRQRRRGLGARRTLPAEPAGAGRGGFPRYLLASLGFRDHTGARSHPARPARWRRTTGSRRGALGQRPGEPGAPAGDGGERERDGARAAVGPGTVGDSQHALRSSQRRRRLHLRPR